MGKKYVWNPGWNEVSCLAQHLLMRAYKAKAAMTNGVVRPISVTANVDPKSVEEFLTTWEWFKRQELEDGQFGYWLTPKGVQIVESRGKS